MTAKVTGEQREYKAPFSMVGGRSSPMTTRAFGVRFDAPIASAWCHGARIQPRQWPRRRTSPPPAGFLDRRCCGRAAGCTAETRTSSAEPFSSNSPRCGGDRHGGRRGAWGSPALAWRRVRIFSITSGSSLQAMTRTAPPQAGQVSMSIPTTRLRRCAQVIAAPPAAAVGSAGSAVPACWPPLPRLAGVTRAIFAIGREITVETREIHPRFGHHGCQPRDEIERLEDDVGRAVSTRCLQLVASIPVRRERQPLFRNCRPADMPTQPFKFPAFIRPCRHPGTQ